MLGNSINIKVDVIPDVRRYWPTVRNRVDMNSGVRRTSRVSRGRHYIRIMLNNLTGRC